MNNARLETSERLQRVYLLLKGATRPLTTLEIIQGANVVAVSAAISELRQCDIAIDCECIKKGKSAVYIYSLNRGRI